MPTHRFPQSQPPPSQGWGVSSRIGLPLFLYWFPSFLLQQGLVSGGPQERGCMPAGLSGVPRYPLEAPSFGCEDRLHL